MIHQLTVNAAFLAAFLVHDPGISPHYGFGELASRLPVLPLDMLQWYLGGVHQVKVARTLRALLIRS